MFLSCSPQYSNGFAPSGVSIRINFIAKTYSCTPGVFSFSWTIEPPFCRPEADASGAACCRGPMQTSLFRIRLSSVTSRCRLQIGSPIVILISNITIDKKLTSYHVVPYHPFSSLQLVPLPQLVAFYLLDEEP